MIIGRPCLFVPGLHIEKIFAKAARDAVRAGARVELGCDHTHDPAHVVIVQETLASLAGDLT